MHVDVEGLVDVLESAVEHAEVEGGSLQGAPMLVDEARRVDVVLRELEHLRLVVGRLIRRDEQQPAVGRGAYDLVDDVSRGRVRIHGEQVALGDGLRLRVTWPGDTNTLKSIWSRLVSL
ncbi:hypothetical protein TKK_0018423 [Trichogramma kaykai]